MTHFANGRKPCRPHNHPIMKTPQTSRSELHRRTIICTGWRREDGLWDIEAELTDTKTYVISTGDRPTIIPGEPLHHFLLRVTIDADLVIQDAHAQTLAGPAHSCAEIGSAYTQLRGLCMTSGFMSSVRKLFNGVSGCTHLTELMGPLATTAHQTLSEQLGTREQRRREAIPAGMPKPRPILLDSCHTYRSDGPAVRRKFPDAYTGS